MRTKFSSSKAGWRRFVHFWVLVSRQFIRHRCLVRASALSYSTLLALIPLLAVALSVTSSLLKDQDEAKLDQFVEKIVSSVAPPAKIPTNSIAAGNNAVVPGDQFRCGIQIQRQQRSDRPIRRRTASNSPPAVEPIVTVNTQKEVAQLDS